MADRLTDLLVAPVAAVDAAAWRAALADAKAMLAGLAVRRAGAGPFRVTDHEVRVALLPATRPTGRRSRPSPGPPARHGAPSAWPPCACSSAAAPAPPSRPCAPGWPSRRVGCTRATRAPPSSTAGWPGSRRPGRAAVGRRGGDLGHPPVVRRSTGPPWGRRRPSGATAGGTARTRRCSPCGAGPRSAPGRANLVVLSGPRRDSVRAELALVTLVESLRARGGAAPGRVVGWWPDSGRLVRVEPEPAVLTLGAEAVALVLGDAGLAVRPAA